MFREKFAEKMAVFFGATVAKKRLVKIDQLRGNFLGKFRWKAIRFALIWRTFRTKQEDNFATTTATETLTTY